MRRALAASAFVVVPDHVPDRLLVRRELEGTARKSPLRLAADAARPLDSNFLSSSARSCPWRCPLWVLGLAELRSVDARRSSNCPATDLRLGVRPQVA
jgi:hypothetical protein